jgi:hypothetical protein
LAVRERDGGEEKGEQDPEGGGELHEWNDAGRFLGRHPRRAPRAPSTSPEILMTRAAGSIAVPPSAMEGIEA